jgi:hypothetical protein
MTSEPQRSIRLELTVQATQSTLLEGLEAWQQLGLLSNEQVKQVCRKYLVCLLPQVLQTSPVPTAASTPTPDFITPELEQRRSHPQSHPQSSDRQPMSTIAEGSPSFVAQRLQALMAEISVIWLLFLGVFMVVVSSGVLAASQLLLRCYL